MDDVKSILDARYAPDGYNLGFNAGAAAGQTIEHLHVHVIPRFVQDVPDPRGGVRSVIPEKASYLGRGIAKTVIPIHLVDSLDGRILKSDLVHCLITTDYDRVDILVSFIMQSGLSLIDRYLDGALDRGACVRVLTTDYLTVTHPDALARLLDLGRTGRIDDRRGRIDVRVFQDPLTSFHPKAYLFWSSSFRTGRGFIGSSNLSRAGIEDGIEWSVETAEVESLIAAFDRLWDDGRSLVVDDGWIANYWDRFREGVQLIADSARRSTVPPNCGRRGDRSA